MFVSKELTSKYLTFHNFPKVNNNFQSKKEELSKEINKLNCIANLYRYEFLNFEVSSR